MLPWSSTTSYVRTQPHYFLFKLSLIIYFFLVFSLFFTSLSFRFQRYNLFFSSIYYYILFFSAASLIMLFFLNYFNYFLFHVLFMFHFLLFEYFFEANSIFIFFFFPYFHVVNYILNFTSNFLFSTSLGPIYVLIFTLQFLNFFHLLIIYFL